MAALMNFMKEVMPHIWLPFERMCLLCCVLSYRSLDYWVSCTCLRYRVIAYRGLWYPSSYRSHVSYPCLLLVCLFSFFLIIVVLIFCFLILVLVLVLGGEGRKPRSDLAAFCLIFAFFASFYRWFCLGWRLGLGRNLVQTPLDFAWFVRFFCYRIAWFHAWRRAKTSFRLGLTLLDFCYFIACLRLYLMCSEGRKPRSDLAAFCLIFRFFCYGIAWSHAWQKAKTSFRFSLTLLDFSHFLLFRCLGWWAWR